MAETPHILIVEAPYYKHITDGLYEGVVQVLEREGATHDRISVAGAFEVPGAIRYALKAMEQQFGSSYRYHGFIALGCVIRGETTHYEHICNEANRALMQLTLDHCIAIGNGILTVENRDQAEARADVTRKNKGGEAAEACIGMIELQRKFGIYHQ